MKKVISLFVVLVICIAGLAVIINSNTLLNSNKTIIYKLNGRDYRLLVASKQEDWKKGLMNYRKLDQADGMIFIFPDKAYQKFWNQNTYLNLEVYWLNEDKIVGQANLPSIEKSKDVVFVSSPEPVNKVIELVK